MLYFHLGTSGKGFWTSLRIYLHILSRNLVLSQFTRFLKCFRRAFRELSESFQRIFGQFLECDQRALISESFQRDFGEPALGKLSESLLLESFQRAFGEFFDADVNFAEHTQSTPCTLHAHYHHTLSTC